MMASIENEIMSLLFASASPLSEDNLLKSSSAHTHEQLTEALHKLSERLTDWPLELSKENGAWKLTLKAAYLPLVRHLNPETELPKGALDVLALIAHREPVLQSEIIHQLGSGAYDHIRTLLEKGFIIRKQKGRSFELRLGETFFRYFEISEKDAKSLFSQPET